MVLCCLILEASMNLSRMQLLGVRKTPQLPVCLPILILLYTYTIHQNTKCLLLYVN